MPKEDPETTPLKKELTDLIAKVKVFKFTIMNYFYIYTVCQYFEAPLILYILDLVF